MAELYLFSQDDEFITLLSEDEGLVDTWFKDYENHVEDEFFVFNIDTNSELLQYIVEENQVAFYDRDGRLRLVRMKDLQEVTTNDNDLITNEIQVICEPSFLELHDHFVEDRRVTEGTAQTALNRALDGSRYVGEVTVELGNATDNFYWIDGIEAVFKILKTWGGALKDTITLNEDNEIIERKLWIVQRLGTDNGLIIEPDYNAEEISRNTLSYPETALWGQGASLEIEDEEGELTGGHTRYITFEDVEWKKSKGDPVDKPVGQKWVGDPEALVNYGYLVEKGFEWVNNLISNSSGELNTTHNDTYLSTKNFITVEDSQLVIGNNTESEYTFDVSIFTYDEEYKFLNRVDKSFESASNFTHNITSGKYIRIRIRLRVFEGSGSIIHSIDEDKLKDLEFYTNIPEEKRLHRFGHFSNQDYEDPEELLWATWQELQDRKLKEIMHEATIYESDKKVSLGDTATILNREYNKPIELQSQITGLEYDILYPDDEIKIVVGKYVDMNEDPLEKEVEDLKQDIRKPRPTKPIDNGSFPDIKPGTPVNVEAHGSFQQIHLFWDYDSEVYISHYEVYGSQISDFVPDEQHLLYRGRVSAFIHEVATDEKWYYYVRAVNTRGTVGEFSNRVDASSVRVISDDILFGEIIADHLDDNLDIADKLAQNTIDRINEGPMEAIEYTQQEIEDAEKSILEKLNNEIGDVNTAITDLLDRTSDVEGTVINVKTDIDTINGEISATIEELTNLDDVVSQHTLDIQANAKGLSAKAEKSEVYTRTATDNLLGDKVNVTTYENKMTQLDIDVSGISGRVSNAETNINDLTGDMSSAMSQIGELDVKANNINASVREVRADLDGLEVGGRNYVQNGLPENNSLWKFTEKNSSGSHAIEKGQLVIENDNDGWKQWQIYSNQGAEVLDEIEGDKEYTLSFEVKKLTEDKITVGAVKADIRYQTNNNGSQYAITTTAKLEDITNEWKRFSSHGIIPKEFTNDSKFSRLIMYFSGNGKIAFRKIKLEKGNRATDWSPAPEDIDANLSEMKSSIDLKADRLTLELVSKQVKTNEHQLQEAVSSIDFFRNEIKLKVDVDGVISSINLSKEGVRIDGNKHHITGQTLIDDGVIGTAAIANLAVDRFHLKQGIIDNVHIADATIEHTKMKSLNVDHVVAGEMDLVHLRAGTIDTDKFRVRGGSSIDYTMIDGSHLTARGRFKQTWKGNTRTYDIRTMLQNGYLRFRNDSEKSSLYYSWYGISTYVDGEGGDEGDRGTTSGSIYWWDTTYSKASPKTRGITVYSYGGTATLVSDRHHALVKSRYSTDIESTESNIKITTHSDETQRGFTFTKSQDRLDGYLLFGDNNTTGLRFDKSSYGIVQVVDASNATGGSTEIEAGYGRFNTIRRRSGFNYLNLQNPNYMMIGLDAAGSARIASNVIYRRTYSSGANVHITGEDTLGRSTSARKYKRDIEPITQEHAYNFFENVTPIYYRPFNTHDENMDHSHYGYIADDVAPIEPRLVQFRDGEPESFSYDRVPALFHVVLKNEVTRIDTHEEMINTIEKVKDKHEDRINILELENQYLKQKIKSLEEKVA